MNAKNVKEYIKKVNIYIKNHKVTSNRNVNKDTNKPSKEKIYKKQQIYRNVYKNI